MPPATTAAARCVAAGPSGRAPPARPPARPARRAAAPAPPRRPAPPPAAGLGIGLGESLGDDADLVVPGVAPRRGGEGAARVATPAGRAPFAVPKSHYGLTLAQMEALGVSELALRSTVDPATLTASAHYSTPVSASNRMTTRMAGGGPQTAGRRGRAPPDLPSLLLDARIVYIGMALVPEVTELVVSELLWLNYSAPTKPVYIYIQSTGSQTLNGDAVAVEQEAFAIIDTIRYIQPDVYTIAIGQALGSAALVLAAGKKGCRYALPNARVLISPPRLNRTFGRTTNMMIKANELENTTATYVKLLSEFTGMHPTLTREVVGRNRWLSPQDAIDAGVIDKVYDVGLAGRLARERTEFEAMKARRAAEDARARAAAEAQQAAQREQGPSSDV